MTRSSSSNGRSSDEDNISGSSRPSGCSYLSNVRPENRSTLCSMMAQLTEETQPSFETTLKSKAVSENCNVKFSCVVTGYPTPQVTWYKDDIQLDRYCGLPKYEIFRNGQNYSLHIYNCTVEDAAMYQASASNNKGIVSCSGVLEVGEMNEFKIHQRYFAKLKQKAENRRREAEGKENQEPIRTISPDRTQRKRRSTMEAFLSTPSSMEDEGNEQSHQAVAVETVARLQEATVEDVEEKPVHIANGAVSAVTNGQTINENGNKSETYINDSAQKIFTAHQPKTPFVKKKIKISNSTPGEQASEERRAINETLTSVAIALFTAWKRLLVFCPKVTQAHTMMSRNDAPVSIELPPNQMDVQPPQKTLSERETTTDDIQTPSLHSGLQAAMDKMTQDTWDHSRGSNESHTVLFTDLQKSTLQSPGGGENTQGCNVSSSAQQSQVDTAIKTFEGTEIQVSEKVEGNEVGEFLVQSDSVAPNEKKVEMETESAALHMIEHTETEITKGTADKDTNVIIVDVCNKETEKNEHILKMAEGTSSALQNLKSSLFEPANPLLTKTQNNNNNTSELQIKDFQEIHKPVTKVISVAELLRSQLKALDSTLANSVTAIAVNAGFVQDLTTAVTETCAELKEDGRKLEVKKSDKKTETSITPPRNIKETLMEVYNQLYKTDQEQIQSQGATSPPVQALQKPLVIPPISVVDTCTTIETAGLQDSDKRKNESFLNMCQENGASTIVPLKDCPVVLLSGSENVKHNFPPSTSEDELTKRLTSVTVSPGPGTPLAVIKASSQKINITVLEHAKGEPVQSKDMLTSETQLNSKTVKGIPEMNSTTLDQYKIEEHDTKNCSLQSAKRIPTKSVLGTDTQEENLHIIQQDSSMVEDFPRTDSFSNPTPEASPLLKKRESVSPIPSATPQELASGARRKILVPKTKLEEASEATSPLFASPVTFSTSPSLSRRSPLLQPRGEQMSPGERRSPLLSRRKTTSETQAPSQPPTEELHSPITEVKPAEKDKHDPFKAPQVIRKIRGETFADASGHLKLWCQFFNVLSDSTIKCAGDETQVNLAIVQASCKDSGVYGCTITNEYGTESTDCLLSADILAGMSLREDLGVGEEIEMTPMIFNKGVADSGVWGNKLFGRIMMQESHIGDGCSHKVWRAKVIYGLEPVFESGNTCIIKVRNPIAYGGKAESCLIDRNLDIIKQECKIQNLAREYCKIFSAEARVIENFGPSLEVIPVYLMYRPANTVPYASVEADLTGVYQKYSVLDETGRIDMRSGSEAEQKCCALQHWIFQWTNGNLLLTRLEGVDTKITNVGISVKSTGHQGLSVEGNPKVFEQFVSQHQCNYFCGLLTLRSLKVIDSLLTPMKPKGSKSPLLQRKMAAGSSSPQIGRKAAGSPRLPRKTEPEGRKTPTTQKAADAPKDVNHKIITQ
uniref:non-specific serine/threonine protein kinase n=1 Tax=Sander lucioperca TaxID=283035 RepID=A0A8C9Z2P7_SANLU